MGKQSRTPDGWLTEATSDVWWTLPRAVGAILAVLVIVYGLGFLATGGDLAIYRFWAPKRANAEREVFVQTQGYVQGKIDYLSRLRLDYEGSAGAQRESLRRLILSEAASVDNAKLPADLAGFVQSLKGGAL